MKKVTFRLLHIITDFIVQSTVFIFPIRPQNYDLHNHNLCYWLFVLSPFHFFS